MIIKSLQYNMTYPLDDDILDNKVLIITMRFTEKPSRVESSGYTITIRKMLEYVNSNPSDASARPSEPETVDQVVLQYCRDECLLGDSDCVEVFVDQEAVETAEELCCNQTNEYETDSDDWFYAMVVGSYISRLGHELPQKVGYLG